MALIYVPLLAVAVFSFNDNKYGLVWKGFTLKWYRVLFLPEELMRRYDGQILEVLRNNPVLDYTWNTLLLAIVSTAIATVLGTAMAIGIDRFPWPKSVRAGLDTVLYLPVVAPDIIFAATLVVAFHFLRQASSLFGLGMPAMIIGHVTFEISFVALVVRSRLATIDRAVFEAARDLYADGLFLFRRVTLPLLMPAIVAGAMLAFTLSLDDFVISFFTYGPDSLTLPIYIYSSVRRGLPPTIHALSTLIVLVTVALVVGVELMPGRRRKE
jgi:spermidine/putrescine transport system permease protein